MSASVIKQIAMKAALHDDNLGCDEVDDVLCSNDDPSETANYYVQNANDFISAAGGTEFWTVKEFLQHQYQTLISDYKSILEISLTQD
jgi:hypothetical protein